MKEEFSKEFMDRINDSKRNIWLSGFGISSEVKEDYKLRLELYPGEYLDLHKKSIIHELTVDIILAEGIQSIYLINDRLIAMPSTPALDSKIAMLLYKVDITRKGHDYDYSILDARRVQINLNIGTAKNDEPATEFKGFSFDGVFDESNLFLINSNQYKKGALYVWDGEEMILADAKYNRTQCCNTCNTPISFGSSCYKCKYDKLIDNLRNIK